MLSQGMLSQGVLAVGSRVEARPHNVDELYYGCEVVGYEPESDVYTVKYEDGTVESGLRRKAMLFPDRRETVYEDSFVRVLDGHMYINGELRDARLLAFQSSPQLFQSAVLFDAENVAEKQFDYKTLAFDIDQAIVFCVPLLKGLKARSGEGGDGIKLCLLGAGGGSVSMYFLEKENDISIDVVELSDQVVSISCKYFGVPDDGERLKFFIEDGLDFVAGKSRRVYDVLIVDVADASASSTEEDGLEIPPHDFVSEDFLVKLATGCVNSDGWVVINILADRETLSTLVGRISLIFPSMFVLATDPNYAFFLSVKPDVEVSPQDLANWAREYSYDTHCKAVLKDVAQTEKHMKANVVLGWYTAAEFATMLLDTSVLI
mmetsp:Transcript_19919/g.32783  ORF Transcript_19919/g.32783 Transcript_19919/m.32783 type:complete len:376 (+) Transcript_19919:291-1418(+)